MKDYKLETLTIVSNLYTPTYVLQDKQFADTVPNRLRKWYLGQPAEPSPYMLKCCRTLTESDPVRVKVTPFRGAALQRCYGNVETVINVFGGTMMLGWKVWHFPEMYLDFEHHGLWRTKEGELICVSPQMGDEKVITFLPEKEGTPTGLFSDIRTVSGSEHFFVDEKPVDHYARCLVEARCKQNAAQRRMDERMIAYWRN